MRVNNHQKSLILVPTYNERDNVIKLINQLDQLNLKFDFLFIDDNSPDKTGEVLDELAIKKPHLHIIHRPMKLGVGSAHVDGIEWAYKNGYDILITMDSDFSHSPLSLHKFMELKDTADVIVGSRYLRKNSLPNWNMARKFLTYFGHFMTKMFLGMPYDATGALRLYRLDKISQSCFSRERSQGYSFFFESLFILYKNGYKIKEIAINLPARTYGRSKMKFSDAFFSLTLLVKMTYLNIFKPKTFIIEKYEENLDLNNEVVDEQGWDEYWEKQDTVNNWFYDRIANFFRQFIIRPYLNKYAYKYFPAGNKLLHAGCGSGQVDVDIAKDYDVIALDISRKALKKYSQHHSPKVRKIQSDIRKMDLVDKSVNGIFSLGVMEHFDRADIIQIFKEFHRVVTNNGVVIIFWPPNNSISVIFLKLWHFILNSVLRKNIRLHPKEISLLESKDQIVELAKIANLKLIDYHFGINDFFTQVVIVLKRIN